MRILWPYNTTCEGKEPTNGDVWGEMNSFKNMEENTD